MIGSIFLWWIVSTILGMLVFPLAWRLFNRLPDRGYGLSRALGLLLSGYILWMGASLGILHNDLGGALGALILIATIAILLNRKDWRELVQWLRQNRKTIVTVEILFLLSFVLWSIVRAYNPEIQHTEQPMDLAFLNAILHSETFPPKDPWLSGYAISYYYFGYVLLAFMTRLTGVISTVAFNLGNALWFALAVVGAYSILLNLLSIGKQRVRIFAPLLGPVFVVITGNLEILFELLHQKGIFWGKPLTSEATSPFWTWLNIERLVNPPFDTSTWLPNRHWWWWQASRVIYDVNLAGESTEMIDEFPFFSFLLADNHPHVLALPFVLLAIAFAFNTFLGGFDRSYRLAKVGQNIDVSKVWKVIAIIVFIAGFVSGTAMLVTGGEQGEALLATIRAFVIASVLGVGLGIFGLIALGRFEVALPVREFWIGAWVFGALAFLNAWDFPFYLSLLFLVILWHQWGNEGWGFLKRFLITAFGLVIAGILFYLPWYPTFSSQAGGILPNLIYPTRFVQFFIMFGVLIVPIFFWLENQVGKWFPIELRRPYLLFAFLWLIRNKHGEGREALRRVPLLVAVLIPLGLFLLSLALGLVAYVVIKGDPFISGTVFSHLGVSGLAPGDAFREVFQAAFSIRFTRSLTVILLATMLFMITWVLILAKSKDASREKTEANPNVFVIFLVGIGTLLVLGPEFVYLKDSFGTRMNTIFKFYYAVWILWGLAAAYATIKYWPKKWNGLKSLRSLIVLPLLIGLLYPILSVWTKTNGFSLSYGPTLDGMAFRKISNPDDYDAIQWINKNIEGGVIAEAVGGSYTNYARISTHTGLSTVLGWPGHELQWRGGAEEQGTRESDIEELYTTRSWQEAKDIVDRYGIDYIYVGYLERNSYQPFDERKFLAFADEIYRNNGVTIYAVKGKGVAP
jgi:YYY domain-containing protein